jgi:hypothetical protein
MLRQKTKKQLLRVYPGDQLNDMIEEKKTTTYQIISAAAVLAGEERCLPDPIVLLLRLSGSNFIAQQWCVNTYQKVITPSIDIELDRTPWEISKKRMCLSLQY